MPTENNLPTTPFRFILLFLRPYRWHCIGLIVVGILWAFDLSLHPYLIKTMLDRLEAAPLEDNLYRILLIPAGAYMTLSFGMNFIFRAYDYISLKMLPNFNRDIMLETLKYTQQHSHSYFQNQFGGSIVTKLSEMANAAENIVEIIIDRFLSHAIALLIAIFTMGMIHPMLALILGVWIVSFIYISYLFSKIPHKLAQEYSEAHSTLIGKLIDSITNMFAVRLFARQRYEHRYIASQAQERVKKMQQLQWSNLKRNAVLQTSSNILVGALLAYLIYARQQGRVTIGDFALILTLSISIIDTIWNISRDFLQFSEDLGRCTQTLSLIAVPHGIIDAPDARPLKMKKGEIKFNHVTFGYNPRHPLFDQLQVQLKPRQKVGLVGFSGSGKTTFVNLILRLYDVTSGQILIDGQDIKTVTQESLHENISYIPQDPLLFHRTILDNIRYGRIEAPLEEVIEAAKKAHAHDFIQALPDKYDTLVGERGVKLSGGQRQRIAIARAILKNAKILILDEATSALDSVTEHYIQESLELLMQDKTVIVVAHRLSTLMDMDRILVYERGRIVEDGSHDELIEQGGIYARLWHMQAGGFLPQTFAYAS